MQRLVADERRPRGLLDTSVIIDLEHLESVRLPIESAVSAITMAELAAGPHATQDSDERARRQDRLQRAEAAFDPLPLDSEASRAYGRIYAAVVGADRKARGARAVDLLIAATERDRAELPLGTTNHIPGWALCAVCPVSGGIMGNGRLLESHTSMGRLDCGNHCRDRDPQRQHHDGR